MIPFIHLHVHTQYSLLDGQASISSLVDKAINDGMPALAITDHGNMFGIKEFINYVNKVNGKTNDKVKELNTKLKEATEAGDSEHCEKLTADIASAQKRILKPIIGCEMYVAEKSLYEHIDKKDTGRHLIVLAKNEKGYHNLIKIVSQAWTEGFYSHPRTDKEQIAAHREGLIICSACLGGEIPRLLRRGDTEGADRAVKWWKDTFGDDYYIELQRHKATKVNANHSTYEEQMRIESQLIGLARKYGIKIIASNDVHFTNEEDSEAHDRLICLATNRLLNDPERMLYTKQEWLKTQEEMNAVFGDLPEALSNTLEICDKVETYSINHAPIMPTFEIPKDFGTEEEYRARLTEKDLFDEFTQDEHGNVVLSEDEAKAKIKKLGGYEKLYRIKFEADYLKKLAYDGAARRYGTPLSDDLVERLTFELHIMKTMGFPGYFLIVEDFIRAGREQLGVSVGPGRGSAAGSVVAYCLGITQIDPLKYDLLFERFLNPDRISLPDIDIDFDDDGRGDVLNYVTHKYGATKVAHIITYGTMAAKSAIKDVARVINLPLSESNRLAKLVPARMPVVNGKELKPTLKNCYEYVTEFKPELSSSNELVSDTLKYAGQLEGNVRNTGVHACGVIICRDDITDWVPVSTATDKKEGKLLVTQYEGSVIEETGLIKMDFLGLKTLSILKEAVANIKRTRGIDLDIDSVPVDDKKTYELYCAGRTIGTFQFESTGMQKYLRELQPSTFEDLIAMNALYRPGPMDYIPAFIARKHGQEPIVYDIPEMEKYLKDTYGVTVYQEQVMLLSRMLANFTRGQSDTLRKAMGKKMISKMMELKSLFLSGGQANGHKPEVLEKIWADWEKFASYAFNKSHATCYSWVAFQTAYLKANYPSEYMAAVLSRNLSDITKLTIYMDECKAMGITVKGPDVNESFATFGVNTHGDIRFGLSAIKGIGGNVVRDILAARDNGGEFKDIYDFVERVPSSALNRRTFENLALAGAFDCFDGIKREDFFVETPRGETLSEILLRYGANFQSATQSREASLFGDIEEEINLSSRPQIKPAMPWAQVTRLDKERELVGMYLSAHPLDPYYLELNYGMSHTIKEYEEMTPEDGVEITFGGIITAYESRVLQSGTRMGKFHIEDYSSSTEVVAFGKQLLELAQFGQEGIAVSVRGAFKKRPSGEIKFNVTSMQLLDDIKGKLIKGITIKLATDSLNPQLQSLLKEKSEKNENATGVLNFRLFEPKLNRSITATSSRRIAIDRKLIESLKQFDGVEFNIEHV